MNRKPLILLLLMVVTACASNQLPVNNEPVTDEELRILQHAMTAQATPVDVAMAKNICLTKCKVCFDGQRCDLQCVKDNCRNK